LDYLKKTIFATIWDYEQAGILDPTIDKDKLLLTNFFKSNAIQSSEKKIDYKNLEYQIDKKIINQQYHLSDNTNQNLIKNLKINLVVQVNGKTRDVINVNKGLNEIEIKKLIVKSSKAKKYIEDRKIIKTIFIKNKIINYLIKN